MHTSLHVQLRTLQNLNNDFTVSVEPELHKIGGEGRLMYKGNQIRYVVDYVGPKNVKSPLDRLLAEQGLSFSEPHDIAWCSETGEILAYAKSEHAPFVLISEPLKPGKPVPLQDRLALEV